MQDTHSKKESSDLSGEQKTSREFEASETRDHPEKTEELETLGYPEQPETPGSPQRLNKAALTVALMVVVFVAALDITIVSIAGPGIAEDLGGFDLISLLFFTYLLTSSVTIPVYGKLADLFGRRKMLSLGIIIFTIGSALCAASPNMEFLAVARGIQGCGTGAIFTITYTIVGDVFPLAERGKIMGLIGSVWGVAGLIGPVAGGLLLDTLGWEWVFIINVPICAIALVVLLKSFDEQFKRPATRQALFPRALITRASVIANSAAFLTCAVMMGMSIYLPIYLQVVMGQNATISGLVLLPQSLTWLVMSFTLGNFLISFGSRKVMIFAGLLFLISCATCLLLTQEAHIALILLIIAITGFGLGGVLTTTMLVIQESVSYEIRGSAMGLASMLRSIGETVGAAIFGLIFNASLSSSFVASGHPNVDISDPFALVTEGILPVAMIQNGVWDALFIVFIWFVAISAVTFVITLFMPNMRFETHVQK